MQDRFKFRIFINNKIQEVFYFYKSENGVIFACTDLEDDTGFNIDGSTLMQCTGLKDKNGTLIYEGDIVKNNRLNNVYSVFWHNDGVCFLFKNLKIKNTISMYVLLQDYKDDLEVIGNIYENAELMKE